MNIKVEELREGLIVQKDVYGRSNNPLIPANSEITKEHIEVLKAFLIREIEVKQIQGTNKEKETKRDIKQIDQTGIDSEEPIHRDFTEEYESAVHKFKREFQLWQTGVPINITNLRNLLSPLLKISLEDKKWVYYIHKLSKPEEYMYHHSIAVSILSGWIGKRMEYNQGRIFQVALAGLLADCGMAKIDERVYINKRELNESERRKIKEHPIYSYQMVKDIPILKPETKLAIAQHHERLDGSGYPSGKKEESLLTQSQIIAISDIYHAMTCDRLYKMGKSPFKVLQAMEIDQFGKLDISILKELVSTIANLPIGTHICLSNGQEAEIAFLKASAKLRPLVKLKETGEILDLEKNRDTYIEYVLG